MNAAIVPVSDSELHIVDGDGRVFGSILLDKDMGAVLIIGVGRWEKGTAFVDNNENLTIFANGNKVIIAGGHNSGDFAQIRRDRAKDNTEVSLLLLGNGDGYGNVTALGDTSAGSIIVANKNQLAIKYHDNSGDMAVFKPNSIEINGRNLVKEIEDLQKQITELKEQVKAQIGHNHFGVYASNNHGHHEYASANHTHNG
jgi:hypothetical protein